MFKNQKKRKYGNKKYGNKKYFYINLHLKDCLDINSKLAKASWMTEKALTSSAVSDAYH